MDDNLWLIELESALLDDCSVNDIYTICRGKAIPESLRPDVWQVCLDVRHKTDQMAQFNEIFDLPFQNQLRQACDNIVDKLGNDDDERVSVMCDLESILTFYCKNRQLQYDGGNGWIELLLPVLSLKLSRSYTYNLFESIRDTYIPKGCFKKGNVFHVFRLLILYHDPELCSLLDTKKITPDLYSMAWFQSLFAATCSFTVVLSMWDLYFQQTDPFLVFFLSLIMLINGRDQILAMKDDTKDVIIKFLSNMPCALEPDDVGDFCALAQYYSMKTPSSFKTEYLQSLFGCSSSPPPPPTPSSSSLYDTSSTNSNNDCIVSQALCLPVSVYELIENASMELTHPDAVRFFLVDCRPAEQYNVGHLSTAFHLDSNLMLQEPIVYATAVQGLLRAQKQAIEANSNAGGEHLCFMGSGRLDEDQYMHMVVASFLQKNTQYVSVLTGGYTTIHDYFGEQMVDCLEDHDPIRCLVCNKHYGFKNNQLNEINSITNNRNGKNVITDDDNNVVQLRNKQSGSSVGGDGERPSSSSIKSTTTQRQSTDIFSKWSAAMKTKSAEVKDKLLDYIVNPGATGGGSSGATNHNNQSSTHGRERHVSSSDKNGKRYRNVMPVFSIDDGQDDLDGGGAGNNRYSRNNDNNYTDDDCQQVDKREIVKISQYLKNPDVITAFKCQEVHMNGYMCESQLVITKTHLIVLRDIDRKGMAQIIVRRPLASIARITAKKRRMDLITFKYGISDDEGKLQITDMDQFLIPNASEVTSIIRDYREKIMDNIEQRPSANNP